MDINFNWDLYDFGTEKIKFRLKVAYECFNHTSMYMYLNLGISTSSYSVCVCLGMYLLLFLVLAR